MGNWFIETKEKTEGTWFLKALLNKSRRFYIKETHLIKYNICLIKKELF